MMDSNAARKSNAGTSSGNTGCRAAPLPDAGRIGKLGSTTGSGTSGSRSLFAMEIHPIAPPQNHDGVIIELPRPFQHEDADFPVERRLRRNAVQPDPEPGRKHAAQLELKTKHRGRTIGAVAFAGDRDPFGTDIARHAAFEGFLHRGTVVRDVVVRAHAFHRLHQVAGLGAEQSNHFVRNLRDGADVLLSFRVCAGRRGGKRCRASGTVLLIFRYRIRYRISTRRFWRMPCTYLGTCSRWRDLARLFVNMRMLMRRKFRDGDRSDRTLATFASAFCTFALWKTTFAPCGNLRRPLNLIALYEAATVQIGEQRIDVDVRFVGEQLAANPHRIILQPTIAIGNQPQAGEEQPMPFTEAREHRIFEKAWFQEPRPRHGVP